MTVTIDLDQGSPAWREWRRTKRNASEAPTVMRANPAWRKESWDGLADKRNGHESDPPSEFVARMWERGHLIERVVQHRFLPAAFPAVIENAPYGASYDGRDPARREWLEVKNHRTDNAPLLLGLRDLGHYGPGWESKPGSVDALMRLAPHVAWQLVQQAAVNGDPSWQALLVSYYTQRTWAAVWYSARDLLVHWATLETEWRRFCAWEHRRNMTSRQDSA